MITRLRKTAAVLAIACVATSTASASAFSDWICRILKIDPAIYSKLSKVRGDVRLVGLPRAGSRLMTWNSSTNTATTVWRCDGCWSPIRMGGDAVAAVKDDGVWQVSGGRASRLVAVDNLFALLGKTDDGIVAIQRVAAPAAGCLFAVVLVRPMDGTISSPTEPPPACPEPGALPRPDTLRANRRLVDSEGLPLTPLVVTPGPNGRDVATPLLPSAMVNDDVDRFEAIWLNDDNIIFVASR